MLASSENTGGENTGEMGEDEEVKWKKIFTGETDKEVVEWVLAGMIRQETWATEDVVGILDRWQEWVARGGMNREDLHFVMQRKRAFAACGWAYGGGRGQGE